MHKRRNAFDNSSPSMSPTIRASRHTMRRGGGCHRGAAVQWRYWAAHPHACRLHAVEPDAVMVARSFNVVIRVCVTSHTHTQSYTQAQAGPDPSSNEEDEDEGGCRLGMDGEEGFCVCMRGGGEGCNSSRASPWKQDGEQHIPARALRQRMNPVLIRECKPHHTPGG